MFTSLQDGPQEYLPLGFISLCTPLPHHIRIGLCGQQSIGEAKVCRFWDWAVKDCGFWIHGSLSHGGIHQLWLENIQAAQGQSKVARNLRPLASSQQETSVANTHVSEPGSRSSTPSQSWSDCSPNQWFDYSLTRDPELVFLNSWPSKTAWDNKCWLFPVLSFGVICYASADNTIN